MVSTGHHIICGCLHRGSMLTAGCFSAAQIAEGAEQKARKPPLQIVGPGSEYRAVNIRDLLMESEELESHPLVL
jgi:hypothetical protein